MWRGKKHCLDAAKNILLQQRNEIPVAVNSIHYLQATTSTDWRTVHGNAPSVWGSRRWSLPRTTCSPVRRWELPCIWRWSLRKGKIASKLARLKQSSDAAFHIADFAQTFWETELACCICLSWSDHDVYFFANRGQSGYIWAEAERKSVEAMIPALQFLVRWGVFYLRNYSEIQRKRKRLNSTSLTTRNCVNCAPTIAASSNLSLAACCRCLSQSCRDPARVSKLQSRPIAKSALHFKLIYSADSYVTKATSPATRTLITQHKQVEKRTSLSKRAGRKQQWRSPRTIEGRTARQRS